MARKMAGRLLAVYVSTPGHPGPSTRNTACLLEFDAIVNLWALDCKPRLNTKSAPSASTIPRKPLIMHNMQGINDPLWASIRWSIRVMIAFELE